MVLLHLVDEVWLLLGCCCVCLAALEGHHELLARVNHRHHQKHHDVHFLLEILDVEIHVVVRVVDWVVVRVALDAAYIDSKHFLDSGLHTRLQLQPVVAERLLQESLDLTLL